MSDSEESGIRGKISRRQLLKMASPLGKVTVDDFNEDAQLNRPVLFAYESSRCPVSGPSRD